MKVEGTEAQWALAVEVGAQGGRVISTSSSWTRTLRSGGVLANCSGDFLTRHAAGHSADLDLIQRLVRCLEGCPASPIPDGTIAFGEIPSDKRLAHRFLEARVVEIFNPVGPDDVLGSRRHEGSVAHL